MSVDTYTFDRPEGWSDDKWEDLCSSLDNALDHFISIYEEYGEDEND